MAVAIRRIKGWGWVGIGTTEKGVTRVVLPKPHKRSVDSELGEFKNGVNSELAENCAELISRYLQGEPVALDQIPVDLSSVAPTFRRILEVLRSNVPIGQTITYLELARVCGIPRAARLIGQAMAKNPVPLLVPCHRVVRSDGRLGGFTGGLEQKKRLLELERELSRKAVAART